MFLTHARAQPIQTLNPNIFSPSLPRSEMSQTLMAFLAMMIAALAAINQYSAQIQ